MTKLPPLQNSSVPSLYGNNTGHNLLMKEVVQFQFLNFTQENFGFTELVIGTIEGEGG